MKQEDEQPEPLGEEEEMVIREMIAAKLVSKKIDDLEEPEPTLPAPKISSLEPLKPPKARKSKIGVKGVGLQLKFPPQSRENLILLPSDKNTTKDNEDDDDIGCGLGLVNY